MIKKLILFAMVLLTTSVAAENEPTYDPLDGSVEMPEVIFLGQNKETEYVVKMQQREGLVFEVTEATPDKEGIIDSDDNRVTYDPDTGLVEIPLIFVRSTENPEEFTPYSVKMQQKEDSDFFEAFVPVEISLDDLNAKSASQSVSPKNRVSAKRSTSRVILCGKKNYSGGGDSRGTKRYFWRKDCPAGWHEV